MKLAKPVAALSALAFALSLAACQKEGPMERAGKSVDNAAEKAGDKIERAGEKIKDTVKN